MAVLPRLLRQVAGAVTSWPVESQLAARRNAMVAATALAARRAEREDVEEFLAALAAPAGEPTLRPTPFGERRRASS